MRTIHTTPVRRLIVSLTMLVVLCAAALPASAQGVGVGGRLAWVKADSESDADRVRFVGGQLRLLSARIGLEVSMDRHSETFEALNRKVTETPIQASLLLRLGGGSVAPYLLGGPGWYRLKVEAIDDRRGEAVIQTTEFGWHAGIGLEIRPSRQFGIHGDYRRTFLEFGDDDDGFIAGLLPDHRGSMWTLGGTIYF